MSFDILFISQKYRVIQVLSFNTSNLQLCIMLDYALVECFYFHHTIYLLFEINYQFYIIVCKAETEMVFSQCIQLTNNKLNAYEKKF